MGREPANRRMRRDRFTARPPAQVPLRVGFRQVQRVHRVCHDARVEVVAATQEIVQLRGVVPVRVKQNTRAVSLIARTNIKINSHRDVAPSESSRDAANSASAYFVCASPSRAAAFEDAILVEIYRATSAGPVRVKR